MSLDKIEEDKMISNAVFFGTMFLIVGFLSKLNNLWAILLGIFGVILGVVLCWAGINVGIFKSKGL